MGELIFLGAGASIEAGIPDSYNITKKILEEFDPLFSVEGKILRFVIGGLMFQAGVIGENPYDGVNIEDLYNTIQILSEKETSEINPFVSSWHPMFSDLDMGPTGSWTISRFLDAIYNPIESLLSQVEWNIQNTLASPGRHHDFSSIRISKNESSVEWYFKQMVQEINGKATGRFFKLTNASILRSLQKLMIVSENSKLEYLRKLIEHVMSKDKVIVTLNYDNCIEVAGNMEGIEIDTGFESWSTDRVFNHSLNKILLLKLHGSIDWKLSIGKKSDEKPIPYTEIIPYEIGAEDNENYEPAVIFGGKNKLRVDGPYLDMIREFEKELDQSNSLIVIGYSFRDDHINNFIGKWINQSPENILTIVDPKFNDLHHDFAKELLRLENPDNDKARVNIIRKTASEGIEMITNAK